MEKIGGIILIKNNYLQKIYFLKIILSKFRTFEKKINLVKDYIFNKYESLK